MRMLIKYPTHPCVFVLFLAASKSDNNLKSTQSKLRERKKNNVRVMDEKMFKNPLNQSYAMIERNGFALGSILRNMIAQHTGKRGAFVVTTSSHICTTLQRVLGKLHHNIKSCNSFASSASFLILSNWFISNCFPADCCSFNFAIWSSFCNIIGGH